MSVRPHPTKGPGWWVIDYYPNGRKGKQKKMAFPGTRVEALTMEMEIRPASSQAFLIESLFMELQ